MVSMLQVMMLQLLMLVLMVRLINVVPICVGEKSEVFLYVGTVRIERMTNRVTI